ncbi:hypothetical protein FM036_36535, partial [Nostoc sp. HG1]|nr:hypothetical protein [Nostoc sp. HG1]
MKRLGQPVIMFAVALPRDGSRFATDLVQAILETTSLESPKARAKADRLEAVKVRSQHSSSCDVYTNAYQLDGSNIRQAFDRLSKQLLPPQNMTDAVVLALCGEAIIPYLKNRKG